MLASFGIINWTIVVVYLLANLGLGAYMSRRVTTTKDYYLGDRSSPWWAIGISVVATYISALSFLGGPAWAYGDGMAALAIHINYSLVVFVCIVFFIPFFYNSGVASIYDYLERRFGIASRAVMGILFMLSMVFGAASILTATAIVITFVTGIGTNMAIVLMTAIVVAYTMLGGMNAVIWTDVLQGFILIIGAGIVLLALLSQLGPFSEALQFLALNDKLDPLNTDWNFSIPPTVWAGVIAMTIYHITVYGANQFMVQRALAAKSIGDAKKAYMLMGFAAFFLYFVFFLIGALLFVFYRGEPFDQPNAIILIFAKSLAIPGLLGIIGAAILSASMSSTSSALNSLSTVSVTDFYQKFFNKNATEQHYLLTSRVFTIFWGLAIIPLAIAFAGTTGSILEVLSKVSAYLVGAKLAMFAMGFFSKHVTEKGLLIGVAAGFFGLMIFAPLGLLQPAVDSLWALAGIDRPVIAWPWYVVISSVINIGVAWAVSLALNGKTDEWHPQTVRGQIELYQREGRDMLEDGWYLVPGKVEPIVWTLPAFFVLTLLFLWWFGTLGG
ncbi:MAG: sodium/solute symporter [Porticoccaceae bacterium]|nr:sodium/solute symporter [Porticoccaceae bacterium]